MNVKFDIRLITTQETLALRKKILKPFLSEAECINPGDEFDSTYHYGLFINDHISSVATFIAEPHADFSSKHPYRLRGMATDSHDHRRGYGKALLQYGISELEKKGCDFLWFNARINAFPFYESLQFSFHGPLFELKDIGPHKVMYKYLNPR